MATGCYPPQVRCYELRELSLKFSRHFEADVVQFQILSADWKKCVFMLADRTIEFHSQFGRHHTTRIPHFGRTIAYQRETCDLLAAGASEDIYRLNLEQGCFLSPLRTGASGINVLAIHPGHGMIGAGTQDGVVQCWDPRTRERLGSCSPFDAVGYLPDKASPKEVTALRFDTRGLQLATGLSSGHVVVYDIRRPSPLLVKDHQYGLPIVDLKYHTGDAYIVSADTKIVKIWEPVHGAIYTTVQPAADINDVALYPDSGMIFLALETERLGAYFTPSLGPAPRWCHFLDNLTEEMEVAAEASVYDDYTFVTREELESLQMETLVGTTMLRPYMHGFFIDARLHSKAVALSQPFAYEQWRKEKIEEKVASKASGRIAPVKRAKPPKASCFLGVCLAESRVSARRVAAHGCGSICVRNHVSPISCSHVLGEELCLRVKALMGRVVWFWLYLGEWHRRETARRW
uniref:Nucleolar protein 10 n=1 Tax=Haptolina ericina TaxID=156174 RepID=A0A7S3F079_9EUKA